MAEQFSIITINYNNAQGLENTIKSVIEQNYKDYQYIIIDGGSTDDSGTVIDRYQDHIHYSVSEKDRGVYHAMNKGIAVARGEYIIFMNSGDRFHNTNVLQTYVENMDDRYGVLYGNTIGLYRTNEELHLIQPEALSLSFWLFNSINHQATAIKRELFELFGRYNESLKITADWQFFVELNLLHQIKFKYIDQFLAYYDLHGMSSDHAWSAIHIEERETFLQEKLPQFWNEYKFIQRVQEKAQEPKIKRVKHFEYIQRFPVAYRFLKSFMDILLFFLPKYK